MNKRSVGIVCSLALGLSCRGSVAADPAADPAVIQASLEAGEFAPAVRMANQLPQADARDGWLQKIAAKQADVGERNAAISTAGAMRGDLARNAALQDLKPGPAARGGNQMADFKSLINLVTSTVAPTTWDEVGGPGSVAEFRTGVYVDAEGTLRRAAASVVAVTEKDDLALLRNAAKRSDANQDAHRASALRKISLPRLERAVQLRAAAGQRPSEEMQFLAGLERIKYVLVYPESGDIVLAGPADHWRVGDESRVVADVSGRPVVRLDDLVVVLRCLMDKPGAVFGCSITPLDDNLKRTKAFLDKSAEKPLKPGQRDAWLAQVREQLGQQRIDVDGIDPRTRAGQTLVEADYHMKLVGMGLEPGVIGMTSYLNSIKVPAGQAPPPLDVLRWWFTMNYDAVRATEDRTAFEIRGVGVQVLGENEMLSALGKRVHTGAAQELNQTFTQGFTDHFTTLAQKYPVYAELQNIFDLALTIAVIKTHNLPDTVGWHMTCFRDKAQYQPPLGPAPKMVDSVINHRVVHRKYILAGVSGGVQADPWKTAETSAVRADTSGKLKVELSSSAPGSRPADTWWWD